MDEHLRAAVAGLGVPAGPLIPVHGGFANRTYRLRTDRGSFAVKRLNLVDDRGAERAEAVFRFERAAFAAGIPMPEPISADGHVVVHRWVEGRTVPEAPAPTGFAFELGGILARLHRVDVEWTGGSVQRSPARDWPELAERAASSGQPWAAELASRARTLLALTDVVDTGERPGPVVLTHRDVQPWNLLARGGQPVLLDWELSGPLDLAGELGSTALGIAKGPGLDRIEPAVFHAVLAGYEAGGGTLPPFGTSWFAHTIAGWLGFTRWNVLRCITGVETSGGPDLATAHRSVRDGLRGLPEMLDRLPALGALLGGRPD